MTTDTAPHAVPTVDMQAGIELLGAQIARCNLDGRPWLARVLRRVRAIATFIAEGDVRYTTTVTVPTQRVGAIAESGGPKYYDIVDGGNRKIYIIGRGDVGITDTAEPCVWRDDIEGGWLIIPAPHIDQLRSYEWTRFLHS